MSQAVQYFKHAASLPAYQPQREKEVLDRVTLEARKSGLPVDLIREVYLLIVRQYVDSTPPYIVHTSLPTKHHGD